MKNLRRIESALNPTPRSAASSTPSLTRPSPSPAGAPTPLPDPRPISFDVQPKLGQSKLQPPTLQPLGTGLPPTAPPPNDPSLSWQLAPSRSALEDSASECLSLPQVATSGFTTHRNAANPALATNLLKEIETLVSGWQVELQQILKQIQDIYLEGAIVDGWLESYSQEELDSPTLRHAEVGCLMDYVEKTWGSEAEPVEPNSPLPANPSGYRLCGLNEDGQLWFRHCPPEQIPAVSLAIARYQKLKLLLARKQSLETRLSQLAETLIAMHAELNQN